MISKIKNNKLSIAMGILSSITLIAIIYAAFTKQVQINGTCNIRDSKWDSHFTDISSAITTGTAKEITAPTINQEHPNTINDYEVSLTTPGDSISYELEVTNDGDYDAILTDYTINNKPICKVGNSTEAKSAQDVCEYLEYKITYKGGALLQKNVDVLKSKQKAIFIITLTYKEFNDSSKLPTENVSIEGLQVSVTYSQGNNKAKVNADGTTPYIPTSVETLLSKTNDASVTVYEQGSEASHQMYTFSHPATEQTDALIDYRYIGSDPYNYVDFNCDDNGENCETWRIVGVFTVKNGTKEEHRVKLIRDEKLATNRYWDSTSPYENDWPSSTLNTYLNVDYYQSLSNHSKRLIVPVEIYLGGGINSLSNSRTAYGIYIWERGTVRPNESRSIKDINNISLLYLSDLYYIYANGVDDVCYDYGHHCYTSKGGQPSLGWLYKSSYDWWLVTPYAYDSYSSFSVLSRGDFGNTHVNNSIKGIRPVVYLSADVKFDGNHTGSADDHYVLTK